MAEAGDGNRDVSEVKTTVPPFNDAEAAIILENLRRNYHWDETCHIIKTWIDTGELNTENSEMFYTILEALHNRAKRVQDDILESRQDTKDMVKVFKKNTLQRVREVLSIGNYEAAANFGSELEEDFTGTDEDLEQWRIAKENLLAQFKKVEKDQKVEDICELNAERDALLEEIKNCQNDIEEHEDKYYEQLRLLDEEELKYSRELDDTNKEFITMRVVELGKESAKAALQSFKRKHINEVENTVGTSACASSSCILEKVDTSASANSSRILGNVGTSASANSSRTLENIDTSASANSSRILEDEARLISLISACLLISPSGRSLDDIYNYVHEFNSTIKATDIEYLMKTYPSVYNEELCGDGAKNWHFQG